MSSIDHTLHHGGWCSGVDGCSERSMLILSWKHHRWGNFWPVRMISFSLVTFIQIWKRHSTQPFAQFSYTACHSKVCQKNPFYSPSPCIWTVEAESIFMATFYSKCGTEFAESWTLFCREGFRQSSFVKGAVPSQQVAVYRIKCPCVLRKIHWGFNSLEYLQRRRDVCLSIKGRVYAVTVRPVFLYGSETAV